MWNAHKLYFQEAEFKLYFRHHLENIALPFQAQL